MAIPVDVDALKAFLYDANQHGYAAERRDGWIRRDDGSTAIAYDSGDWRMVDTFFGGDPFGGMAVVFRHGRAVWIAVYYGRVEPAVDHHRVYAFLREALRAMPAELPLRGPATYAGRELQYHSKVDGEIARST